MSSMRFKNISVRSAGLMAGLILTGLTARSEASPDAWVTSKIKIDLITTSHVDAGDINVDTIDGKVTLHGTVDTAEEKQKAEAVAKGIKGVKEVRNLLQVVPKPQQKMVEEADDRVQKKVEDLLKADTSLKDSSIKVKSVNKGVVLLSGKAKSMFDYLRAVETTASVSGVRNVASEITSTEDLPDLDRSKFAGVKGSGLDAWITTETKMRLLGDSEVPALDINVDTHNGVVTLFGMVPSEAAKAAAMADAKKVDSVVSVKDELQVVSNAKQEQIEVADKTLEKNIEAAFKTRSDLKDIHVSVQNGVARLTGNVGTAWNRLQAATVARSVKGVRRVQDDLHLEQPRG